MCIVVCYNGYKAVKKDNELTIQQTEMRLIRWMCGVTVTDWFTGRRCSELRETRNR